MPTTSPEFPAPLGGPPPAEVPLPDAPLVRVLAQVRFTTVLFIDDRARLAPFQADLRRDYPVFREEEGQNLTVDLHKGAPAFQTVASKLWRFGDVSGDWTVTLTPEAVTLETRAYGSRADFLDRLRRIVAAVEARFAPGLAERLGIRYVTRVRGEGYRRIEDMIRPDLLGVAIPGLRANVRHAVSEAVMRVAEGDLALRWGMVPANGSIDPFVAEPIGEDSWMLDMDVSSTGYERFEAAPLITRFDALAARAYAVFRYVVTTEFLSLHGGKA